MTTAVVPIWNNCTTNIVDVRVSDLNIDPSDSGGLRFAASSYGYLLPNTSSFIPTVVVPLVTTGNLFSANLIFSNDVSDLGGTLRLA